MLYLIEAKNTYNAKVAVNADNPKEAHAKYFANRSTIESEEPLFSDDVVFLSSVISCVDAKISDTAHGDIDNAEEIFEKVPEDEEDPEPIDYYSD